MSIGKMIDKWFPAAPDRKREESRLARFYAEKSEYHAMTASGKKTCHPQVRVLECLIHPGGRYVEIGCGSGAISRLVGETASVIGVDVSPLAIERARHIDSSENVEYRCAPAEKLPLSDNDVDGCYSFEVFEHVWDPVVAVKEMMRITKPGGFLLMSMPVRFSLDLRLKKSMIVRYVEILFAVCRYVYDTFTGRLFQNVAPHLDGDVYSDCDMITAIVPANFVKAIEAMGCTVDFWDTTYMCAHRDGSSTTLSFQSNAGHPFYRHFGDHVLILAHKKCIATKQDDTLV